jgi:putative transposase
VLSGVRFRAYPTAKQSGILRQWIGHQRFIYNAKVREKQYWDRFAKSSLALTGLKPLPDQAYSQFIGVDTSFLREVPPQILRNGAYRFATGCTRALKRLGGAPRIRKRHGRQSVMVTSELFELALYTDLATRRVHRVLTLGTKKFPLGRLKFNAHRECGLPKSLCISVEPDGQWYVSFCFESPSIEGAAILRTPEELAYEFSLRPDLEEITLGIDRGVVLPVAASDGQTFKFDPVCEAQIARKARRIRRYRRRLARQQLGSKRRLKTKQRIGRLCGYGREVRKDFAHKVSFALANSPAQVFVLEDLKLKNMTAAPAPKQDAAGRHTGNGAAAKAGLNKALLSCSLGQVSQFLTYKAARRNKLVLKASAAHSSNECALCGHIASENRLSQAEFCCVSCGHRDNADHNASCVMKSRGIARLKAGTVMFPKKKAARVRGRKDVAVGPVRPEPGGASRRTPVENVSDERGYKPSRAALLETGNPHYSAWA